MKIHFVTVPYSCDVGEHVRLVYDEITGIAYHETCFPSGSDNLTQDALLGKTHFLILHLLTAHTYYM